MPFKTASPSASTRRQDTLLPDDAASEIKSHLVREVVASRDAEAGLAAELEANHRLQRLSAELIREEEVEGLYQKIVDAAAALMGSDCASMQSLHSERGTGGELELLASRGFTAQAARFWAWVRLDSGCSCAEALRTGQRVIVSDIESCDFMAGTDDLSTFRQTGIRAMQTTPLIARSGRLLGMISTHWHAPHEPPESDLHRFDVLARQAADLIERAHAVAALRRSEGRFRALVEASAQIVWMTDAEGAMIEDSPTWRAYTGQTHEEWRGIGWLDVIHPHDRGSALEAWRSVVATRSPTAIEYRLRTVGGEWRWMSALAAPIFASDGALEGYVVMGTDIHESKRAGDLRAEQRQLLELVASGKPLTQCLTALTAAVSRLQPLARGGVLLADEARKRIERAFAADLPESFGQGVHGVPINELAIGTCGTAMFRGEPITCPDIAHDEHWSNGWRELCAQHGVAAIHSTPVLRPDGTAVASFFICFTEPREPDSWDLRIAEFGVHVVAITLERDRAEATLRERGEQLREANRRKDEFLAMLAHELRNPLAPIGNASEILSRTLSGDARARGAVEMIMRQTAQMTRLIDDLLDVSRITQGRIQLRLRPLDVAGIVAQAVETVEPQLRAKRHELSTASASYEPLYVSGDETRLLQCFVNVLANAVKYTNAGGQICVRTRAEAGSAVIEIADTGVGIVPELLPKVFDLFVQSDRTLDRAQGGLGIGLCIVKRLMELHGGEVTARSGGSGPEPPSSYACRGSRVRRPSPRKRRT